MTHQPPIERNIGRHISIVLEIYERLIEDEHGLAHLIKAVCCAAAQRSSRRAMPRAVRSARLRAARWKPFVDCVRRPTRPATHIRG